MKVRCLSCGHNVNLDEAYDDYTGEVKCFICSAILEMAAQEGKLKSMRLGRTPATSLEETTLRPAPPSSTHAGNRGIAKGARRPESRGHAG